MIAIESQVGRGIGLGLDNDVAFAVGPGLHRIGGAEQAEGGSGGGGGQVHGHGIAGHGHAGMGADPGGAGQGGGAGAIHDRAARYRVQAGQDSVHQGPFLRRSGQGYGKAASHASRNEVGPVGLRPTLAAPGRTGVEGQVFPGDQGFGAVRPEQGRQKGYGVFRPPLRRPCRIGLNGSQGAGDGADVYIDHVPGVSGAIGGHGEEMFQKTRFNLEVTVVHELQADFALGVHEGLDQSPGSFLEQVRRKPVTDRGQFPQEILQATREPVRIAGVP